MSLLIVGSCSRVTSNIVHALSKSQKFQNITIADLLPAYSFHQRYYRLRKQIDQNNINLKLNIQKIFQVNQFSQLTKQYNNILYVTHDYYEHVTSKLKLMQLTAQNCKNKQNVYFVTPVQYDQFNYEHPQQRYQETQKKVRQICPQSTIIRSDIQDQTQTFAYIHARKNIIDDQLISLSLNQKFRPKVVQSGRFAKFVSSTIESNTKGKVFCVAGNEQKTPSQVKHNIFIQLEQIKHIKKNVRNLVHKYCGIIGQGAEVIVQSQ